MEKKIKVIENLTHSQKRTKEKHGNSSEQSLNKRQDFIINDDEQNMKKRNFIKACEQVSYNACHNYGRRFNLVNCNHQDKNTSSLREIEGHVFELFRIGMKLNLWDEALEVCFLSIHSMQYLSDSVLKDVVEIILNAHENASLNYPISNLLERCQNVLSLNFNIYPPCITKSIRKGYVKFLSSSMDLKENTFTNRSGFDYNQGVVKYCLNRLEDELSSDSKDEALIDTHVNTQEEINDNVRRGHWRSEKFEIYETLDRSQRIERLMVVLDSIIELLQIDIAIWQSRRINFNFHLLRSQKPLMANILWSENVLFTGAVTKTCTQIIRLFVHFVHLQWPDQHIKTISLWVNIMIQTFYICENKSNSDYPTMGKYCAAFANEFYKILSVMPHASILKILKRIQPTFMRYLISMLHLKRILSVERTDDEIIKLFIDFIQNIQWQNYPEAEENILVPIVHENHTSPKMLLTCLSTKCHKSKDSKNNMKNVYPKLYDLKHSKDEVIDQNFVISLFYITFHAYLDAYSIQKVQETWVGLNKHLEQGMFADSTSQGLTGYSVSEIFIKKYRVTFQMLKEVTMILHKLKKDGKFPELLRVFESINFLSL